MNQVCRYMFAQQIRAAKLGFQKMDMKADKKSTLLCLHGMLGSKTNFRSIVKNVGISDHIKDVYLVDLRNHGDSEHTPTMTFEELGLDLKHFIETNQLSNVVLLGHSFGARNIWAYLQHQPQHADKFVNGIVIVDITPSALKSLTQDFLIKLQKIELQGTQFSKIREQIETAAGGDKSTSSIVLTNILCKDKVINEALPQDFYWRINLQAIRDSFQQNANYEFQCNWQKPARVICGENSSFVNQGDRQLFQRVFPSIDIQKDIVFIPNCGHYVHVDKPYEFIKLVGEFIQKI